MFSTSTATGLRNNRDWPVVINVLSFALFENWRHSNQPPFSWNNTRGNIDWLNKNASDGARMPIAIFWASWMANYHSTPVAFLTPSLSSSFRRSLVLQLLSKKVKIRERAMASKETQTIVFNTMFKWYFETKW